MAFSANGALDEQNLRRAKREVLRAAAQGLGMTEMLRQTYLLLGANVSVCSMSLSLMSAYPPGVTTFFYEQGEDGLRPSSSGVQDFFSSGNPQRLLSDPDTPFLARYRNTSLIHLFCGIRIKQTLAAYLCIIWNQEALPEDVADYVVFLCQVLSLEMQKNGISSAAFLNRELILSELLNGHDGQIGLVLEQFPDLLEKPPFFFRLCMIVPEDERMDCHGDLSALRDQLGELFPQAICYKRDTALYVLMPDWKQQQDTLRWRAENMLHGYRMVMLVSSPISTIYKLSAYLRQVKTLLNYQRQRHIKETVLLLERCLPICAFEQAYPVEIVEEWLHPHIRRFAEHDRTYHTAFIDSLAAYLRCGRRMQAAADALFIHKTTLIYRFSRMQEMTAPFLQQPELLFLYEYSLRLMGRI